MTHFHSSRTILWMMLVFFAWSAEAQRIEKFALCKNVEDLEPIGLEDHFDKGARAYCWLTLADAQPGSHLFMDWYWEGRLMHASKLDLPYRNMRTYGYKTMTKNGGWKVAIRSQGNQVLYEHSFKAGVGVDPLNPVPPKNTGRESSVIILNPEGQSSAGSRASRPLPEYPISAEPEQAAPVRLATPSQRISQYVPNPIMGSSRLLLPEDYDPELGYPLIVMLPFEGGRSNDLYSSYLMEMTNLEDEEGLEGRLRSYTQWVYQVSPDRPFMLLLPEGKGKSGAGEVFEQEVRRYEQRLFTDIERLRNTRNISRVILAGYSLGADMSWALLLRNPTYFNGALLMSSRYNYVAPERLPLLGRQGARCYLFSGEKDEDASRQPAAEWAKWQLSKFDVPHRFVVGQGLGHAALPPEALPSAFGFLLR